MPRLLFGAEPPLHPGLRGVSGWSLFGFAAVFGVAAILAGSCVCIPSVLAHVLGWGCGGTGSCVTRVPQDCGFLQVPPRLLQEDVWRLGSL